jgi:hypothetical protein
MFGLLHTTVLGSIHVTPPIFHSSSVPLAPKPEACGSYVTEKQHLSPDILPPDSNNFAAVVACHVVGMMGNYYLSDLRPSRRLFFRCPIFC